MSDKTIEQLIQEKGLMAPRVTPEELKANIASVHYFTAREGCEGECGGGGGPYPIELGLLTICVLVLRNGFTVTGESACASPENFDAEVGRNIARDNAINKIWPLMGYHLKQKLKDNVKVD